MHEIHKIRFKSVFERDICQPLLQVHLWATSIIKQYGAIASASQGFHRLFARVDLLLLSTVVWGQCFLVSLGPGNAIISGLCEQLKTRQGLNKVKAILASGSRIHGTSATDVGILVP